MDDEGTPGAGSVADQPGLAAAGAHSADGVDVATDEPASDGSSAVTSACRRFRDAAAGAAAGAAAAAAAGARAGSARRE